MAESFVQVGPDSTGKLLRTETSTQGGNTVHSEVIVVADPTGPTASVVQSGLVSTIQYADGQPVIRGSANNLNALTPNFAVVVTPAGMWSQGHTPAGGSQATTTKAASVGIRHICTSVAFGFSASTAPAATLLQINLRDGTTGAGTILWTAQHQIPAAVLNPGFGLSISGLAIANTTTGNALTLEFSAGLANLIEWVSMTGYDAS